jgi:hypothetical protein
MDTAFVASSGTWNEGLVAQQALQAFTQCLLLLLCQLSLVGRDGLSLTDTSQTCPIWYKHQWEYTLGSWRPDQTGSVWEVPPSRLWSGR